MSSSRRTRLLDREKDLVVEATLFEEVTPETLIQVHIDWQPVRLEGLKRVIKEGGKVPEHWHWDWSQKANKLRLLAYRCFGIECERQMQGLMMVSTIARRSRIANQAGKPVLYVEYIESAPWNLTGLVEQPRYSGVGIAFLEAAIQFSLSEGFGGRLSLHSLPQSEPFYQRSMTDLGIDEKKEGLRYYEMTAEQAQVFLEGRGK
jgi:hypothetical protein